MTRVPTLSAADLDSAYQDLVVSSLQPGKTINVYSAIANNPAVLEGFRAYLGSLWTDSGHSDRHREIVILTVAARTGSAYEWHQHVNIATNLGMTPGEITAIAQEDTSPFPGPEVALIEYTAAVVEGDVTDEVHAAVTEQFDDGAVVGLAAIAAGYLALARLIEALDVELEDGEQFVGWSIE